MVSMHCCASCGRRNVTYALPLGPLLAPLTLGGMLRFTDTCSACEHSP